MTIERISETQIKCTLDHKDLSDRELKLSELAYGGDKANALFRDMIQKASSECNFEAENSPLMIEAIPISADCLILLITKVTDPEELDARFSNFTAAPESAFSHQEVSENKHYADEIIDYFECMSEGPLSPEEFEEFKASLGSGFNPVDTPGDQNPYVKNLRKVYLFSTLDEVITVSKVIRKLYHGENTLYKDPAAGKFYLLVHLSDHTPREFNKICNIISEYGGVDEVALCGRLSHFDEHFEVIVRGRAVQVLSKL